MINVFEYSSMLKLVAKLRNEVKVRLAYFTVFITGS